MPYKYPQGAPARTFPIGTRTTSSTSSSGTSPRAIWASNDEMLVAGTGQDTTNQFFSTRVKTSIAGGNWAAIAPVYCGSYLTGFKSPVGTNNTDRATLSFTLELGNGSFQNTYTSTNAGSTAPFQGTFNGNVDAVLLPGDILVGDWVYPTDLGLSTFNFSDRTKLPWIRTAWSKNSATDVLGALSSARTEYNYPCNSHIAICDDYAHAKTLGLITGVTNYNSGNNFYSAGGSQSLPAPIGWIGIPASGQKAIIAMGTSIRDGDGSGLFRQGGVNPANNTMSNYDLPGWPNRFGGKLTRSVPVLNFGVGASTLYGRWSPDTAANSWMVGGYPAFNNQRLLLAKFCSWFDLLIADDVNNDSTGTFPDSLYHFTRFIQEQNPTIKIYGVREPNGGIDISGATVPYGGGLDTKWSNEDSMVTNGYWDGMMTNREDINTKFFVDAGVQLSSTTTSNGTTTSLIDSGQNWLNAQWTNSWIKIGGVKQVITGCVGTTMTFNAFAGAVNSGTAYTIEGNTTSDQLHPNTYGQWRIADNLEAQLASKGISIPYFTRTQS